MLFKLFYWMYKDKIRKLVKSAYLKGLNEGFTCGYNVRIGEERKRGLILSRPAVEKEIEEILERNNF